MSRDERLRALAANDAVINDLGVVVECTCEDCVVVSVTVTPRMCNAYNICHGAYIFLIADVAMSLASSVDDGVALASGANIDWLLPVECGDTIRARTERQYASGPHARWAIMVSRGDGTEVSLFRGKTKVTAPRPS